MLPGKHARLTRNIYHHILVLNSDTYVLTSVFFQVTKNKNKNNFVQVTR